MDVADTKLACRKCGKSDREGKIFDDYRMIGGERKLIIEIFICKDCLVQASKKRGA